MSIIASYAQSADMLPMIRHLSVCLFYTHTRLTALCPGLPR